MKNQEVFGDKAPGDYRLKLRITLTGATSTCMNINEAWLHIQLVANILKVHPLTIDPALYGTEPIPVLVDLPKLNYTVTNADGTTSPAIGNLFLTLNDNTTRITSTDSFQPAFFETSANEQHILHLPAGTTLKAGHSYTVGLQEQGGTVPAFMVWAVPVQVTAGTEATAAATVTPKTINRLTDKDADGNLIKQLTVTDPTVHFTKNGTRSIRIVKVASDGTETEVYPKTLIQNGTNGTIITENYTEGNTTVQVSHNFTDKATYPKGTYKVELYLTDTATKPVAEGTFVIAERPLKLVFFHDDHLGTPRLITDEDGQTVSKHDYLAYGEEITTADFQTNRMKFTGHERDPETGLDYMLARYYTSGSGRFLQVDPGYDYDEMDPMSFNLYGYVRGNPVNYRDPYGLWVDVYDLTPEQRQTLFDEWSKRTGLAFTYNSKTHLVEIDWDNSHDVDFNNPATQAIYEAVTGGDGYTVTNDDGVRFAVIDPLNWEGTKHHYKVDDNGVVVFNYSLKIDFSDWEMGFAPGSDERAKEAYSIGFVTIHELFHKVFHIHDEPRDDKHGDPGPCARLVNQVRRTSNLPVRWNYAMVPDKKCKYFQDIFFISSDGTKLILRIRENLVGK